MDPCAEGPSICTQPSVVVMKCRVACTVVCNLVSVWAPDHSGRQDSQLHNRAEHPVVDATTCCAALMLLKEFKGGVLTIVRLCLCPGSWHCWSQVDVGTEEGPDGGQDNTGRQLQGQWQVHLC